MSELELMLSFLVTEPTSDSYNRLVTRGQDSPSTLKDGVVRCIRVTELKTCEGVSVRKLIVMDVIQYLIIPANPYLRSLITACIEDGSIEWEGEMP